MEKILSSLEKYILYIVLVLFPVFVLSNNTSPFVIPKEILLVVGVSLVILIWVVRTIIKGSLTFSKGKFDLGVLLIAVAYLVATFLATPNKMEAYLLPGTTTFVLGGAVLYFLINQLDQKAKNGATIAVFISGLLLSLTTLVASLNAFTKIPQLPAFIKDPSFNPMGGAMPSIILLIVVSVFSISLIIKEKEAVKRLFYGVSLAVILFGLVVLVGSVLPGKSTSPQFDSMQDSWEISVETLKTSPFIGVGPANYLTAFNLFRPVTYNQTNLWQVRFTSASNFYFTLLTETGFVGLFALAVLLIAVYKHISSEFKLKKDGESVGTDLEIVSLIVLVVLFAVLPVIPSLVVYLFALLALFSKSEHKTLNLSTASAESNPPLTAKVPAIILGVPVVVGVLAVMFFGSKLLYAEATFAKALDALNANDAKDTYNLMNSAINQNPNVDRYHASFAQVNMALASSIASQKNISDTDRSNITQLVQQAISEGKATVALNPQRSGNWEVLAQIYRSIMPFAKGADQFTVQTYTQSIALDPTNPNLRIALGGVYYSMGNYSSAIDTFKLAVLAKPDFANSYYNLAIAYRENKDYPDAANQMQTVLSIVPKDSSDYQLAQTTLNDIKKNIPVAPATQASGSNLQAPQPAQTSTLKPPINLPKEATPPATISQ